MTSALPPSRAVPAGRISAAANALTLAWSRAHLAPDAHARVLARCRDAGLDPAAIEAARGWAPFASHVALLQALAPEMQGRAFFDLGRENAAHVDRVMPGASLLLKLASPKRLLGQADVIWRTYADFGRVSVLDAAKDRGDVLVAGVDAPPAFWDSMAGFFAGLLQRTGARSPSIAREARADGCAFHGAWS